MKRFFTLFGFTLFCFTNFIFSQSSTSWHSGAPDGNWKQGAGGQRWSNSNWDCPGTNIISFNNNTYPTMDQNCSGINLYQIFFASGASTSRTIGGSTITIHDWGGTWGKIENQATSTLHTFNCNIANSSAGLDLIALNGSLAFGGTITSANLGVAVYGNNTATDANNRYVRIGILSNGTGKLFIHNGGVAKINGACTYTGNTELNYGELWIESGGSLASGSAVYVGNGGQLANVTKLWLSNTTGGTTFSNNMTINNGNVSTRFLGGLNTSGTHTFSGTVAISGITALRLSALNSGGTTEFSNVISGGGTVTTEGAGTVVLSGANSYTGSTTVSAGTLKLNKAGGTTIPNTNDVIVTGGTLQISSNQTLNNLTLNGGNVTVDDGVTLTVNGTLALTNGKITLGTGNVVLGSSGTITGASLSNYIVTTGLGTLTINNLTTARAFPVGASASSYSPVTITNTGTVDNFSVKVGTVLSGPIVSSKAVGLQWNISEETVGGSNATLVFEWPVGAEGGSFVRGTGLNIGHHNGSTWDLTTAALSGSGPYTATASGFSSFSPFGVMNDVALSLELKSFTAQKLNNRNTVEWTTADEKDMAWFNIEKSGDSHTWQTIGTVKATNNPMGAKYNFTDDTPLCTISYYRLQMVDRDGKTDYSKVVSLSDKEGKQVLSIYPNPVKSELSVLNDGNTDGTSRDNREGVLIYDMTGKIVRQFNDNRTKVNVADLPNGVYFVRLLDKNGLGGEPVRFVKQ